MAAPEIEIVRRRRPRPVARRYNEDRRSEIVNRVIEFRTKDDQDRKEDQDRRLELHAKMNGWTSGVGGGPWPDSSDIDLPDIRSAVLKTEDDLVNRQLSSRPLIGAKARDKQGIPKQRKLEMLLDTQLFEEQPGEQVIHETANCFVRDGGFVAFVPWIEEDRKVIEVDRFPEFPEDEAPRITFLSLIAQRFGVKDVAAHEKVDSEGWSWRVVADDRVFHVDFYTREKKEEDGFEVERVIEYVSRVFDGPRVLVKDYEDVLTPPRSANLQPRGPSNPEGASHVIVIDTPTVDEIRGLAKRGTYSMLTKDDLKKVEAQTRGKMDEPEKDQKDALQGSTERQKPEDVGQQEVTRLTCYDAFAFEKDGPAEDMVFTVLVEPALLARAVPLTELYPISDGEMPMRPFAESSYLPVKGRRQGESLPAIMVGLHDYTKILWDQMADAGTLQNLPFGFYRPGSSQNPELADLEPGVLYPVDDPKDIVFPNLQNNAMAFGLNMITKAEAWSEELTLQGDLQSGRVPQGQSAALRTAGGINTILAQGEARPERVLRRYFMGILQMHKLMHRLNKHYLSSEKAFRYAGFLEPGEDPYVSITRQEIAASEFDLSFSANMQNSTLAGRSQVLDAVAADATNPLALQIGVSTKETLYRLFRDRARARGADPDAYFVAPSPEAVRPKITAAGALEAIMQSQRPNGDPLEAVEAHIEELNRLLESRVELDDGTPGVARDLLKPGQPEILALYQRQLAVKAKQEQAQKAQLAAAAEAQRGQPGAAAQPGLGLSAADIQRQPAISGPNELLDETLPTAGGGGNRG